jgi:hypothetical protein
MVGTFDSGGYCFSLDDGYSVLDLAAGAPLEEADQLAEDDLDRILLATGRVPDLGGAPIASWVLARLSHLAGRAIRPAGGVEICEGAVYVVDFLVRTGDGRLAAKVQLQGGSIGVGLLGIGVAGFDPRAIASAFASALIERPGAVAQCEVRVLDPAWGIDESGEPNRYGFDGTRYLGIGNR